MGSGGAGEISEYQVNIMNMAKYVQSFQDRDDVSDKLKTGLKVDALLITGSKSSSLKACDAMFQNCNKVCMAFYHLLKLCISILSSIWTYSRYNQFTILDTNLNHPVWWHHWPTWTSSS